jgi:outer membrane protein TolC
MAQGGQVQLRYQHASSLYLQVLGAERNLFSAPEALIELDASKS